MGLGQGDLKVFRSKLKNQDAVWLTVFQRKNSNGSTLFQEVALCLRCFPSFEAQACQLLLLLLTMLGALVAIELGEVNQSCSLVVALAYTGIFCCYDLAAGGACGIAFVLLSWITDVVTESVGGVCYLSWRGVLMFWSLLFLTGLLLFLQTLHLRNRVSHVSISKTQPRISLLQAGYLILGTFPFSLMIGLLFHFGYKPQLQDDIFASADHDNLLKWLNVYLRVKLHMFKGNDTEMPIILEDIVDLVCHITLIYAMSEVEKERYLFQHCATQALSKSSQSV